MRVSIIAAASLDLAFQQIPVGSTLLHYLSQPKNSLGSKDKDRVFSERFYACLDARVTYEDAPVFLQKKFGSPDLGYVPQDAGVLKKRFTVLGHNNRAYELATIEYPVVGILEEFASLEPCFSLLFALKMFLHHHYKVAIHYRGMLPFGSHVIAAVNAIDGFEPKVDEGKPSFQDHVRLMVLTNRLADKYGMTPLAINDQLYLEGRALNRRTA
jgi:hypothetical protein